MTEKSSADDLLGWLYARASEVFERAGDAAERHDLAAHTEAYEEHQMLSAMIAEINTKRDTRH